MQFKDHGKPAGGSFGIPNDIKEAADRQQKKKMAQESAEQKEAPKAGEEILSEMPDEVREAKAKEEDN